MRQELRDGQWADLRDPATLTAGQRKPIMFALGDGKQVETGEIGPDGRPVKTWDIRTVVALGEAACAAFIEAWSFPFPVPADNPGWVDQIPALVYDELTAACSKLIDGAVLDTSETGSDPTVP